MRRCVRRLFVSRDPVMPARVEIVDDIEAALRDRGVDLRILPAGSLAIARCGDGFDAPVFDDPDAERAREATRLCAQLRAPRNEFPGVRRLIVVGEH